MLGEEIHAADQRIGLGADRVAEAIALLERITGRPYIRFYELNDEWQSLYTISIQINPDLSVTVRAPKHRSCF